VILLDVDHELVLDKNYATCSCGGWSVAATAEEAPELHGGHVRHADSKGMVSCVFCGGEQTTWNLLTNHGGAMGYLREDGACMAMHLRQNHVLYAAKQPTEIRLRDLPKYVALAREVWARAGAGWLDEYEALCRPLDAPTHHAPVESEEVSLW